MSHSRGADIELKIRPDRTSHSVTLGKLCNQSRFADTALLARVKINDVAAFIADQLARVDHIETDVIRHDWWLGFTAHASERSIVSVCSRLFDECDPAVG